MKSAIQELIEMLPDNAKKALQDNDNFYQQYFLEKEKQQIIDAYCGAFTRREKFQKIAKKQAEDYYNQTFK